MSPWMRKALREAGPARRGRILAARRGLRLGWHPAHLAYLLVISPAVAVIGVAVIRGQIGPQLWGPGRVLIMMGLLFPLVWWRGDWVKSDLIQTVTLEHDLCPSCAGDLAAAVPQGGLVRCAGCGAQWRERQGRRVVSCGACGYDLRGLEAGEDGMVRCPECGARWRVGEALLAAEKTEGVKQGMGGE